MATDHVLANGREAEVVCAIYRKCSERGGGSEAGKGTAAAPSLTMQ